MLNLALSGLGGRVPTLLALGAHSDDVEIGAGGTLLTLAAAYPGLRAHVAILGATPVREAEARASADAFLPGADVAVHVHDIPDGRLPAHWDDAKNFLEQLAQSIAPDIIIAPSIGDAHQDHRGLALLVPTAFRDHLVFGYEIPKWENDLAQPSVYVPLTDTVMAHKARLLQEHFGSQRGQHWFDDEVFFGLARLRGMQTRSRYAEAFFCSKVTLDVAGTGGTGDESRE